MKQSLLLLLIFLFSFSICKNSFSYVVLLDPGHGGHELGAISRLYKKIKGKRKTVKIYEKDLSLILAKKIKKHLSKQYTVYLTRSFDRAVPLHERAKMADTVKADLFISIHFNSSNIRSSHGFETYYLDNHNSKANKKVQDVENKYLEGKDKVVNQILIDLVIQKTVSQSKKLATYVHSRLGKRIKKRFKIKDRGVKPGLFYVLALSKRPGLLLEAGFMSNNKEIQKLRSGKFLNEYAKGVSEGIIKYLNTKPKKDIPLF